MLQGSRITYLQFAAEIGGRAQRWLVVSDRGLEAELESCGCEKVGCRGDGLRAERSLEEMDAKSFAPFTDGEKSHSPATTNTHTKDTCLVHSVSVLWEHAGGYPVRALVQNLREVRWLWTKCRCNKRLKKSHYSEK